MNAVVECVTDEVDDDWAYWIAEAGRIEELREEAKVGRQEHISRVNGATELAEKIGFEKPARSVKAPEGVEELGDAEARKEFREVAEKIGVEKPATSRKEPNSVADKLVEAEPEWAPPGFTPVPADVLETFDALFFDLYGRVSRAPEAYGIDKAVLRAMGLSLRYYPTDAEGTAFTPETLEPLVRSALGPVAAEMPNLTTRISRSCQRLRERGALDEMKMRRTVSYSIKHVGYIPRVHLSHDWHRQLFAFIIEQDDATFTTIRELVPAVRLEKIKDFLQRLCETLIIQNSNPRGEHDRRSKYKFRLVRYVIINRQRNKDEKY